MTIQGLALGLLIGVIPPALYHLLRGGSLNHFLLLIAAGWVGFFLGHALGQGQRRHRTSGLERDPLQAANSSSRARQLGPTA